MYPYRLNSANPIDPHGMDAVLCLDGDKPIAGRIYPTYDDPDRAVRIDYDGASWGYPVQSDFTWFEVDLHDPIVALQILRRYVTIRGGINQQHAVRYTLLDLCRDDDAVLTARALRLRVLLSEIDPSSDIPVADVAKETW